MVIVVVVVVLETYVSGFTMQKGVGQSKWRRGGGVFMVNRWGRSKIFATKDPNNLFALITFEFISAKPSIRFDMLRRCRYLSDTTQ